MNQNNLYSYPRIEVPPLLKLLRRVDFPFKKGLLQRLFGSRLSQQGIGWASTWNGTEWLIDGRSPHHQWMITDRYADPRFLKWAEKNIAPDACIIDSGSNIGQFIPYFARIVPRGIVIGFEPSSELHHWVDVCIQKASLHNVEILRSGLGETEGLLGLSLVEYEYSHGLWNSIVDSETGDEIVEITTLFRELETRDLKEVALWKLDVEGYEIQALKGAETLLEEKRIGAAYIELVTEHRPGKIVEYMGKFNYRPYRFTRLGLKRMTELPGQHKADVLFLP